MAKNVAALIVATLSTGPMTRTTLAKLVQSSISTVSRNLSPMLKCGAVVDTHVTCECCGTRIGMLELVRVPYEILNKPKTEPKPKPRKPVNINVSNHDGSVFGSMLAQMKK